MFNFLKKKNKNENKEVKKNTELLSKTASLLIHAAKMDQKYSDEEKEIIRKTMIEMERLSLKRETDDFSIER